MELGGRDPSRPPAATTAEEETVKRNTDCVYFLASPLTCKKGHECEYRHSEGARVNPRDCWYWLNGNCLNPKCLFRHPPLDALLATPTTPSGLAVPPLQAPTISQTPAPLSPAVHNPNKQSVPCYYFQKGLCLKGDRCPFMHGPQPIGNPVSQQPPKVAASVTELPQTTKKASWGLEKCVSQQSIPRVSVDKLMEVTPSLAMPVDKTITAPANGLPVKNYELPIPLGDEHPPRSQPTNLHVSSDITPSRPHIGQVLPSDEHFQNGREAGEFLRESSPGFDVLVDDEPEDPDYYRNDDDFGGISGHGVRNLNPVNDFDYLHTASDYDTATKFEREPYNGTGDYDRYGVLYDRHSRKHHRASSERILERSPMPERKGYRGDENPDETDGLDLRHRLLKQRRLNGSGSAVIPDRRRGEPYPRDDRYTEEQRYRGHSSRRDQRHFSRESSIRNRLQGRITLPVQPSSDNTGDLHSERGDRERGRSWGRSSSPGRLVSHQGRHHDRLKLRAHEDFTAVARNVGGQSTRRDEVDDPLNFAGPKSLAELKGAKVYSDNSDERSTKRISGAIISQEQRNMKLGKALGHQEPEESLPFEGPKPLSVILKRKRESSHGNAAVSSGEEEDNNQTIPLESKTEANDSIDRIGQPQDRAEEEEEGLISMNGEDLSREVLSSARGDVAEMEDEIGMDMEDPQLENYEQRNGESDYEAMDGGEFKTEEDDEIAYEDDGDLDDEDDGDDFARKLGVIFS